jgi:hypothetical protein
MMRIMARRTEAATVLVELEIAHQSTIAANPGESPFDDPALG